MSDRPGWLPRRPKWLWRDFLTEDEISEVRDLERRIESARYELAQTIPLLNPIRNRAIQRAKYRTRPAQSSPSMEKNDAR